MPPSPKFSDACRLVGRIEVHRQFVPQQQGNANGHIGITRKIAVNLQGISIHPKQVFEAGIKPRVVENPIHKIAADIIGNNSFFKQANANQKNSFTKIRLAHKRRFANLWQENGCPYDRASHHLREKCNKKSKFGNVLNRCYVAAVNVDSITQALKSEERNTHRQENVERVKGLVYNIIHHA